MFEPLRLIVLTPETTLLDVSGVQQVQLRLSDGGGLGVFPGHAPLVAEISSAPLWYIDAEGRHHLDLDSGILQISSAVVTVFTSGLQTRAPAVESSVLEEGVRFERLARDVQHTMLQGRKKATA
ncbi:MAG: hypothetical protein JW892_10795 [Anaerolineae bacterium]|nr:hypothetical protein [Anaerolineae bacterium]